MKRPDIPDPIIVSLVSGKETPTIPAARVVSPTDLRQAKVDEFIAARSLKPKSEQAYRRDLQYFMDWTQQAWANVTRRQVAQFKQFLLQDRGLAPNSVNRILRTLKTFYKWMLESEYISSDPTTGVKQEKVPEAQSQELEDEEVEQIYAAIAEVSRDPVRDRALFSVLLHGLRAEEAINLNFEDYDGQQVVIREAKHDSVGEVPLTRQAREDLNAYVQQRQTQAESTGQEVTAESPLFVSNSNRSRGQRLTYWGGTGGNEPACRTHGNKLARASRAAYFLYQFNCQVGDGYGSSDGVIAPPRYSQLQTLYQPQEQNCCEASFSQGN